jgi:signal peptidase I
MKSRVAPICVILLFAGLSLALQPWSLQTSSYIAKADPANQCLPWTWYFVSGGRPDTISVGDMVVFTPLGLDIPGLDADASIVKFVVGVPGDRYELSEDGFYINGFHYSDLAYPQLLIEERNGEIPPGELLVAGVTQSSFDSRYFGTVPESAIVGTAVPALARKFVSNYHGRHDEDVERLLDWIICRRSADCCG